VFDVQGDVAEIAGDVIAGCGLERFAVVVPLDPQFGITDGFHPALQMRRLGLFEFGGSLQLADDPRWSCRFLNLIELKIFIFI